MRSATLNRVVLVTLLSALFFGGVPKTGWSAPSEPRLSKGQTVYVPVYSNVFAGPKGRPFALSATVSIRNTDLAATLRVTSVDYHDSNGRLIRRLLGKPLTLGPLATSHFRIEEKDAAGGFGANMIVRWEADRSINAPIIECVMIGGASGQGISFVSQGQEIRE